MTHSMCVCVFVLLNIIRAFLGVVVQISLPWQVNFLINKVLETSHHIVAVDETSLVML